MRHWIACALMLMGAMLGVVAEASAQRVDQIVGQPIDPAGRWAIRSQGRPMAIVTLRREAGGWRGEMERPATMTTDASMAGLTATGPAVVRNILSGKETPRGLELTIAPPAGQAGGAPITMLLVLRGDGTARLKPAGAPGDGFVLNRAQAGEALFTAWVAGADYPIDQHWQTNAEMTRMFEADQAARTSPNVDWAKVAPEDAGRRKATRVLLDAGELASADDFYHAAFIFQHGDTPEDFLLAHTLATVSAARGKPGAAWIAAATLDRYLQAIGQKQIYGTQYRTPENAEATQEPYDRALISDALRGALGVPPQAEQEETRKGYSRRP